MKLRLSLLAAAICILAAGCSKFDGNDFADTHWTGEFISSDFEDGVKNEVSFEFFDGKADFVYLVYGEQYPEKGVLLYTATESTITFSKANDDLNGQWNITSQKGKDMTLTRTNMTINLRKRQ
jgi:hypothetical protein